MTTDDDASSAEDELLSLAGALRSHGSLLPQDLARAGELIDSGSGLIDQILRLAARLLATVLSSVRILVWIAVALALTNTALFILPRRGEQLFWYGAAVILVLTLLPAFALNRLGKRFAAFRDAVDTIATRIPSVLSLPSSLRDEASRIGAQIEETSGKRLPGRLIGRARVLLRVKDLITSVTDEHRELISATTTAVGYGPQDVLLATYGVVGIAMLLLCLPVFAVAALLA